VAAQTAGRTFIVTVTAILGVIDQVQCGRYVDACVREPRKLNGEQKRDRT
jgi:hypothetical protein